MNFGNIPQIKNQITKWIFRKHPADQPRMFNLPTDFQFRFPGIFNPYPAADALKSVPTGSVPSGGGFYTKMRELHSPLIAFNLTFLVDFVLCVA